MRSLIKITLAITVFFTFVLFYTQIVLAQEQQTTGPFKQNKCVALTQICANCTYVNITQINIPGNNTQILSNQLVMTKVDTVYNYSNFCITGNLGRHIINWKADPNGEQAVGAWEFYITTTGYDIPIALQFLFISIIYFLLWLGIYKKDITITLLATLGLYFVGIWLLLFGFNIYRTNITEAFAWINLAVAFYLSLIMANEYIT